MSEEDGHGWTHVICRHCYEDEEPGRDPVRVRNPAMDHCCFCGIETADGIFYRAHPNRARKCPDKQRVTREQAGRIG